MSSLLSSTPRSDGFWMPAEYERHAGCWMIWPERPDNWREQARPAQAAFAHLANTLAEFEPVTMAASHTQYAAARRQLHADVRLVEITTDDAWMRDTGPTFVRNKLGVVRAVDWIFNAWGGADGGLYGSWDADDQVAAKVAEIERIDRYRAPLVLEGGSIHVDGEGTCLTTEECLLNANRNPALSRTQIEGHLRDFLGIEAVLWLGHGVYLDETDGHIDNLCCFLRPGVVALTWTDDVNDPQYAISQDAYRRLAQADDARGRRLEIIKLPQPRTPLTLTATEAGGIEPRAGTQPRRAGTRLAASYVNFLIANDIVVVPAFDDPNDARARDILAEQFPDRRVRQVAGREILLGGGNVHCITQQQPLARVAATD